MNDAAEPFNLARLVRGWAAFGLAGRVLCTTILLCSGFAGLSFLFAAEAVGPGKLQVHDSVSQFVVLRALDMIRVGVCIGLMLELALALLVQNATPWRRLIFVVPLLTGALGALIVWRVLFLDELETIPKIVMLLVGAGVVFFLASSMHATLWQASFEVAPEVNDFPFAWYLVLIMLMSAFFGGFRGWTDVNPIVRKVIDYRDSQWKDSSAPQEGRPVDETWIQ